MAGRGLRRTMTISDHAKSDLKPAAAIGTPATTNSPSAAASFPVGGLPSPCRGGRTLIDIIREEQKMNESGSKSGSIRDSDNGTVNWKSFKDRIRLRRAGNAWSEPESEYYPPPNHNPNPLFARSFSGKPADEDPPVAGEPAKMSLMALFEQTEGGGFGSEGEEDDDEEDYYDDGDDDGDGDDGGDEGMYNACCVCMVRHKGPAFIPCGHTFCRLCSKELFVSRGNCPLCNGFILEILNIF